MRNDMKTLDLKPGRTCKHHHHHHHRHHHKTWLRAASDLSGSEWIWVDLAGSFTSPVQCSFNRSIMPCGVPVQLRCNWQQAALVLASVTDGRTGGAAHRRNGGGTQPHVGCPVTGRTRVYIPAAAGCGARARECCAALTLMRDKQRSPASGPQDTRRKVADF